MGSSLPEYVHRRKKRWAGQTVLSWDIGTTNLAFCMLEYVDTPDREYEIHFWENMDLRGEDIKSYTDGLRRELLRREWMLDVDHIAIESQSKPNTSTKVLSHAIQLFFSIRGQFSIHPMVHKDPETGLAMSVPANIHFVSAAAKFKVTSVPDPPDMKKGHSKNKTIAQAMAKKVLARQKDTVALSYINAALKQDDLADSFIQGLVTLRDIRTKRRGGRTRLIMGGPDEAIDGTNKEEEHPTRIVYCSDTNFTNGVNQFDIAEASLYKPKVYARPSK